MGSSGWQGKHFQLTGGSCAQLGAKALPALLPLWLGGGLSGGCGRGCAERLAERRQGRRGGSGALGRRSGGVPVGCRPISCGSALAGQLQQAAIGGGRSREAAAWRSWLGSSGGGAGGGRAGEARSQRCAVPAGCSHQGQAQGQQGRPGARHDRWVERSE